MPLPQSAEDAKRLATLAARAALLGVTVHRIEGDFLPEIFVCSKWAMTVQFADMDALDAWLTRVQGGAEVESS